MATASESNRASSASASWPRPAAPRRTADAPFAMPTTMSFVDSWPSTVMRLKLRSTASMSMARQSSTLTAASQVTKQSIVAMCGEIMPQPLAAAPRRTTPSARCSSSAPRLGKLSVVRIAWLKCSPPPGFRVAAAAAMPGSIFPISRGAPITPVEATATVSTGRRRCCAVSRRMRAASASPSLPVHALALPALTTTAWRRSQAAVSRVSRTGAAAAALLVNVAAETVGRREHKMPRSSLPRFLTPVATPAATNASGNVTLRSPSTANDGRRTKRLAGNIRAAPRSRAGRASRSCSARPAQMRLSSGCRWRR